MPDTPLRSSRTPLLADNPAESASSTGYSAVSQDGQEELLGEAAPGHPDHHTAEGTLSRWDDDDRASEDFPQPLTQEVTEREFEALSGEQTGAYPTLTCRLLAASLPSPNLPLASCVRTLSSERTSFQPAIKIPHDM